MKTMLKTYSAQLLKIGGIAGMFYSTGLPTDTIVVYGIGAPIVPDGGLLPDASVLMQYPVDLFVPDYIGYGRSDGVFTPQGCINTFLQLHQAFSQGCKAQNTYTKSAKQLQYNRIIHIGRSLGGTYVPLLPRFNPAITELAIFCPVVDSKSCGSMPGEETNAQFLASMQEDGYHHLYRGILSSVWEDHLENKDDLSPMDNIAHLANAKLFITHGKKDECVHYSKSQKYYELLQQEYGDSDQFALKLYSKGGHDASTTNLAADDFMGWLGLKKGYNGLR